MTTLDALLEPIRHSPWLVEAVDLLQEQIADERRQRQRFYAEMTPEQKVEFIDGDVILHSPARNSHLIAISLISRLLSAHVDANGLGFIRIEKCLCVFPRNDYEPDIVFFDAAKAADLKPDTLKFPIPDLAIEVLSESTQIRDRGVKYEDYAAHGVSEYWIVDPDERLVEQYVLGETSYELIHKSTTGTIESRVAKGFSALVPAFFDEAENVKALRRLLN